MYTIFSMEWLKIILLGIIQGKTEWVPISSTGHMLLFNAIFPLNASDNFINVFMVLVQLSSILAVFILYFKTLNPFKKDKLERNKSLRLWSKVLVATIPSAIAGLLLSDIVDEKLSKWPIIAIALAFYGVIYIVLESKKVKINEREITLDDISYKDTFLIGLFQMLALVPGTSRSGSTIIGGRLLGLKREVIAEFSFFMAIPVMAGASLLRIVKYGLSFTLAEWGMLFLGIVVSFIISLFSMKILIGFVKKHTFRIFGIYRIVLAIAITLYFLLF